MHTAQNQQLLLGYQNLPQDPLPHLSTRKAWRSDMGTSKACFCSSHVLRKLRGIPLVTPFEFEPLIGRPPVYAVAYCLTTAEPGRALSWPLRVERICLRGAWFGAENDSHLASTSYSPLAFAKRDPGIKTWVWVEIVSNIPKMAFQKTPHTLWGEVFGFASMILDRQPSMPSTRPSDGCQVEMARLRLDIYLPESIELRVNVCWHSCLLTLWKQPWRR